jgi:hypothetical protein
LVTAKKEIKVYQPVVLVKRVKREGSYHTS